jgi:hypothetical protein
MRSLTSAPAGHLRRTLVAAAIVLLLGACTLILDRDATECTTDADCVKLGVHPSCQNGACVNTGVPCFPGTPATPSDFLNQCSVGTCLPFDDCTRLHVCGDAGPPLVAPPPAAAQSTSDADSSVGPIPNCADLPPGQGGTGTVYVTGSSNFPTLMSSMAPTLYKGVPAMIDPGPAVVYLTTNSCTGADAVFSTDVGASFIQDPPPGSSPSAYAQYYLPDGGTTPCSLGPNGTPVDVGESDVYATTCNPSYTTTTQTDSPGPIQAMAFVVPSLSDQQSISQEAAREVFGLGGNDGGAAPWTDYERYYVRNKNTGTQQMIGKAIGVPPDEFWGIDRHNAQAVHADLQELNSDPAEAEQAIGIISVAVYDSDRNNLRALAFTASGQDCAYLPDSTATSYDKRNVRDGQYPIWGPIHFFTANQASPQALAFVNFFNGATVIRPILDAFINASLIPLCAMTVLRSEDQELSELVSFTPQYSCACYFLSQAQPPAPAAPSPLPAECKPCTTSSDCPAARPACNLNFCEVQ